MEKKHKFPLYIFYGRAQNQATTKYSSIIHDECYLSRKERNKKKQSLCRQCLGLC